MLSCLKYWEVKHARVAIMKSTFYSFVCLLLFGSATLLGFWWKATQFVPRVASHLHNIIDNRFHPSFLRKYKNPCFDDVRSSDHGTTANETSTLLCFPYFVMPGFPKCGTTDLYTRLSKHPQIKWEHPKEPDLLHRHMYKYDNFGEAVHQYYVPLFRPSIHRLQENFDVDKDGTLIYTGIIGDASVDYAFNNSRWQDFPGNKGVKEPRLTHAHFMYSLYPKMKVIFMLREPVERLYSDYIFEARAIGYKRSPKNFHQSALKFIKDFNECLRLNTRRGCAYNRTFESYEIRLRAGMYHIFVNDWIQVFGKENVLVLMSETTKAANQRLNSIRQIVKFLEIEPFSLTEEKHLYDEKLVNVRLPEERSIGDMLSCTRELLQVFYAPFNIELTKMFPYIDYNSFY
ncbi:carbohydrate sulfotransferase 15-like isoform X2 [Dreissena polymorpha]|uniref:carbohydrate sulfotransferase 15-like isoform X2 n=1 Tax=Dreissena polymorpha TaxID=45954 RepID=UPI002263B97D|nr:carbohydrate sulfotransferase 15-like isoform X2 [Dreissena polymorpha]